MVRIGGGPAVIGSGETRGDAIRWARERLGVTQGKFGELLGVHVDTVGRYERENGPKWLRWAVAGLLLGMMDRPGAEAWLFRQEELLSELEDPGELEELPNAS